MILLFLLKLTAFFAIGFLALALARRTTAAARHTLCAGVLVASLLLPLSWLVPVKPLVLYAAALAQQAGTNAAAKSGVGNISTTTVLALIWLLGCAIAMARLVAGYRGLAQLRRSAQYNGAGVWLADVNVPVAMDPWKPVVLVPRDFIQWPSQQQQAALHHERAHIQRCDL